MEKLEKLEKKPFALIGVNVGRHTPKTLKEVMEKEKLPWRSFVGQGSTGGTWHVSGTPAFYVIDPRGVIRHKWVGSPGDKVIDAALEDLLREAEGKGTKTPR
ncbi:MAG: TlpA family protein disulfide reductase [Planctomycetes bacterium]|nr:TlpA family protein disulfide reductase [Planctomycetota bacterium]